MQADRVRPGREGGREEGEDGAVLEEASSFHRSISLSHSLALSHPFFSSICTYQEPACVTNADGRGTVS